MKKLLFLMMLIFSASAFSGTTVSGEMVATTHVNTSSGFYFRTNSSVQNPDGCSTAAWYHIKPESLYAKEAFSIVLAAHMANKKIQFWLDGCDNGYPSVGWVNTYDG